LRKDARRARSCPARFRHFAGNPAAEGRAMPLLLLLGLLLAAPATAQTGDELFDPSVLNDVRLTMKADDWQTLKDHYLEDTYYRADFQWRGTTVPIVGVRSRGTGSRNPHKPGLKIAFDQYLDQKPFGLKSIVMANAIQDPAMLKQRLGLLMYARMGLPSPRVVHARLFVNDEYIGLYELIEPIDKPFLARVYGTDAAGKVENGGYLYEYHWKADYAWDYLGSDLGIYAELFEPKTHESDPPAILYQPFAQLFRDLNDAPDSLFERTLADTIDLPQFVRFLAVENFIAEHDGFLGYWSANNFYVYRFQGQRLMQFLPWDKDEAFWERRLDIFHNTDTNVLASRVLAIPSYRRLYLETLAGCAAAAMAPAAEGSTVGWLEAQTVFATAQIRQAGYNDREKRFSNERFDDELDKVLRFARERGPYVLDEVSRELARMAAQGLR
jgi:CotH protein